jgi:hypothetical protein
MLYLFLFLLVCVAVLAYVVSCLRRDIDVLAGKAEKSMASAQRVVDSYATLKKRVDALSIKLNSVDQAAAGMATDSIALRNRVIVLEQQLAQSAVVPVHGAVVQKPKMAKPKSKPQSNSSNGKKD